MKKGSMHILVVAPARRSKNKTENDTPPTLSYFRDEQFGLALATSYRKLTLFHHEPLL